MFYQNDYAHKIHLLKSEKSKCEIAIVRNVLNMDHACVFIKRCCHFKQNSFLNSNNSMGWIHTSFKKIQKR